MKRIALAMGAIAFFTLPALAASDRPDNSMIVAENGGVSVHVGEGDHDHDLVRRITVVHHRDRDEDRDRHRLVIVHRHHEEHGITTMRTMIDADVGSSG